MKQLDILLVDDDEETLRDFEKLLRESLPDILPENMRDMKIEVEPCGSFPEARRLIQKKRYDLIITDIYAGEAHKDGGLDTSETEAGKAFETLQHVRFTPMLAMTSGSRPADMETSPFFGFVLKRRTESVLDEIVKLLETGIPQLARELHDELDHDGAEYVWKFLHKKWEKLKPEDKNNKNFITRLIRRRVAFQIGRMNSKSAPPTEIETVEGLEFYIYPSVSENMYHLGELIQHNVTGVYSVVLTPHCHLTIQPNKPSQDGSEIKPVVPRAEFVLTVGTEDALEILKKYPVKATKPEKRLVELRKRIQGPSTIEGATDGRYWFLPGFVDIPSLYCDFLQVNSIPYDKLKKEYAQIAIIDTPFAESLQSSFTSFYSAVGTPNLDPQRFRHFLGEDPA